MLEDTTSAQVATIWQQYGVSGLISAVISGTISVIGWRVSSRNAAKLARANRVAAERRDIFDKKFDAPTAELFSVVQQVSIPTTAVPTDYTQLGDAADQISQKSSFLNSFVAFLDINRLLGEDGTRVELTDLQTAVARFAVSLEGLKNQAPLASVNVGAFLGKCDDARREQQQVLLTVLNFRLLLKRMAFLDVQLD